MIGVLYGNKNTLTGIIDVVSVNSIYDKNGKSKLKDSYGMVIVDECHHGASAVFESVLNKVNSKYVYGVSANDKRIDRLEKGETVEALQMLDQTSSINSPDLKIGDKIYLYKHESEEGLIWYADQYDRAHGLIILAIAFVGFVIIFGRKKGVNTIIALVFTCLSVFNVYVPAILKGYNIYLWSIITCLYIGVSTLLIVQGTTKKSFASMIGCSCY